MGKRYTLIYRVTLIETGYPGNSPKQKLNRVQRFGPYKLDFTLKLRQSQTLPCLGNFQTSPNLENLAYPITLAALWEAAR